MLDRVLHLPSDTLHVDELRAVVNGDAFGLEVGGTQARDVRVLERKNALSPIDQVDLGLSKVCENGRELAAHDTRTEDDEAAREALEARDVVRGHDGVAVHVDRWNHPWS